MAGQGSIAAQDLARSIAGDDWLGALVAMSYLSLTVLGLWWS